MARRRPMRRTSRKASLTKTVSKTAGDMVVETSIEPIKFTTKVISGKLHKK